MVGVPVIINHKDITDKNADDERVGVVNSVWYDNKDGWYWCDGIIWNETAQNLITDKNWSVSCSYNVKTADNEGGSENNIKYDMEFLDGVFTHLALVNNPRYERANIVLNSKTEFINVNNEDKWITVKPNGEENTGRHLLIKDGETVHEALQRTYGIDGAKGQQKLFDTSGDRKTKEDFRREKEEKQKKVEEHQKQVQKRYDNLRYLGVAEPDQYEPMGEPETTYEEWIQKKASPVAEGIEKDYKEKKLSEDAYKKAKENFQKTYGFNYEDALTNKPESKETYYDDDMEEYYTPAYEENIKKDFDEFMKSQKKNKETYYEPDMEEHYTKSYEESISKDYDEFMKSREKEREQQKESKPEEKKQPESQSEKTDLEAAKTRYNDVLSKYNAADKKRWESGLSNAEYHQAWADAEKYKKELTGARREYAESIMANFQEVEENPYEERQQARRERYEELSGKAATESSQAHQQFRDKMSFIPAGQPIHGERDARYRERAWDTLGRAVKLNEKSNYYADKAKSVGKAGISSDDANAIAKLARKYKSGVDSAEKRRIIDRVIDIHKRSTSTAPESETTDYGFSVERNKDLNRLQLKFDSIPDANTRAILKSNGFRWSPREKAWQRQLNSNSEYSLKSVMEKMKADNSLLEGITDILEEHNVSKDDLPILEGIKNILG